MCWQVTHNFHCTHFCMENKSSFIISVRIISIRNLHDTIFWKNSYFLCCGTKPYSHRKDILIYILKKIHVYSLFVCMIFSSWIMKNKIYLLIDRRHKQQQLYMQRVYCLRASSSSMVVKPGERCLTAPPLADMVCSEQSWRRAWVCGKFCQQM